MPTRPYTPRSDSHSIQWETPPIPTTAAWRMASHQLIPICFSGSLTEAASYWGIDVEAAAAGTVDRHAEREGRANGTVSGSLTGG